VANVSKKSIVRREGGASAVEAAIVMPVLVAILLGIFDFGRAYLAQQALTAATREGARTAIAARPVTDAQVTQVVNDYLNAANVTGAAVSITPSVDGVAAGTQITVQATVPFPLIVLPRSLSIQGTAVMVKE
jgi:Flp pilus assembly protein TadG